MILIGGIWLGIVLVGAAPTLSSACRLIEHPPPGTAAPFTSVLKEHPSNGTGQKFKGESGKKREICSGDLLYIEEHPHKIPRNIQEKNELSYGDRRLELKLWGDEWMELTKTFKSLP